MLMTANKAIAVIKLQNIFVFVFILALLLIANEERFIHRVPHDG